MRAWRSQGRKERRLGGKGGREQSRIGEKWEKCEVFIEKGKLAGARALTSAKPDHGKNRLMT